MWDIASCDHWPGWSLSGAVLQSCHEWALSHVGSGPDNTLDVART